MPTPKLWCLLYHLLTGVMIMTMTTPLMMDALDEKTKHLTIFFTSWHCIFFFFFLFVSYKISLD